MILRGSNTVIGEIPEINFGTLMYHETEGPMCAVISVEEVSFGDLEKLLSSLMDLEYVNISKHRFGEARFWVYTKEDMTLNLSYYPTLKQLRLVGEQCGKHINYADVGEYKDFTFLDKTNENQISSLLTQVDLYDFGMSYIIRLSDGRFIIIDGGRDWEADVNKLIKQLCNQALNNKISIAAWIFTHPHLDHYRCFMMFYKKYGKDVNIERFIYNFPELNELCVQKVPDLECFEEIPNLVEFERMVVESGIPVIRPHTGHIYQISNARLEILSSPDDSRYPCEGNELSLIIKMEIEGQSILFCADSYLKEAYLVERYGDYLKSDMLQLTHHGFNGGCSKCYHLIDPEICLAPVSEVNFYGNIGFYNESNRALLYDMNVQEMFTGGCGDVVLELPYVSRPNGKILMFQKAYESQKNMGAKSWVFVDLTWEECEFSFLNAVVDSDVYADLYYEDSADMIREIQITLPGYAIKKVCFKIEENNDGNVLCVDGHTWVKKTVHVGKRFAVHFTSKNPVIIWGKKKPVYVN